MSHPPSTESRPGLALALAAFVLLSAAASVRWLVHHHPLLLSTRPAATPGVAITIAPGPPPVAGRPQRLAVTVPTFLPLYDDIGAVLEEMGEGYRFDRVPLPDLVSPGLLKPYSVLFLCCSEQMQPTHVQRFILPLDLENPFESLPPAAILARRIESFVAGGGAVYASDWAAHLIHTAFPGRIAFAREQLPRQEVLARVRDRGLADLVGDSLQLRFDIREWFAADEVRDGTIYLEGDVGLLDGRSVTKKLLVAFQHGRGQVVFTSFHNERQRSSSERTLLKYLVLKPIVAQAAHRAREHLVRQNMTLRKESLFSTGGTQAPFTLDSKGGEDLTWMLSWNVPAGPRKARLALVVGDPAGRTTRKEGEVSPISISIPKAAAGVFRYQVEAMDVPFAEFPYVVSVGVKE